MDRIRVCGTRDAGSIPAEGTDTKIHRPEVCVFLYLCPRESQLLGFRAGIEYGVAKLLRAKRGSFVTDSCRSVFYYDDKNLLVGDSCRVFFVGFSRGREIECFVNIK